MRADDHLASRAALIVVDVQRYFFDPSGGAFLIAAPAILPNILKVIAAARGRGLPIAFTRHAHRRGEDAGQMGRWWNGELPWEGTPDAELVAEIKPATGEIVVAKQRYSAFEGTDLAARLKGRGVEAAIICGVMTNLCVETTARHAFMLDIEPTVVEDASAANTPEHHRASLLNLSYGFARIERTDSVMRRMR